MIALRKSIGWMLFILPFIFLAVLYPVMFNIPLVKYLLGWGIAFTIVAISAFGVWLAIK